jgi:hypothetical protein
MKNKSVYFLCILLAFTSCTQKQDPLVQVEQGLKSLSDLGTVEYVVSKIVKADDDATWYKFGKRKILFSCKASLKAGIDLSELPKDSIEINDRKKSISLVLPSTKLLSFNMKPSDIRLAYEKTAITRFSFSNEERDMIMAQGEKNIKESIAELGILADAEKSAKTFLEAFLLQAGYSDISIRFSKNQLP